MGAQKLNLFYEEKELDCSYGLEGVARFRLNIFLDRGESILCNESLKHNIPNFSQIGLPDSVQQLFKGQEV